ncbi:TPA: class I SAM-dependent methyltransferase [Clostridioides difficile]|nr:class I SAM-dependent methyltransferase [Clostridioides difficile]
MKQNKYDDDRFFNKYSKMERSTNGLAGAGEWHVLKKMLPDFKGKRVLDLGCGFGWHCQYAVENGAISAVGVDISEKMLKEARNKTQLDNINYICMPIEDICKNISNCLSNKGNFVFSVEHPIFTAYGSQEWYCDKDGNNLHWPVDRYFEEGVRRSNFLGEEVIKYHKTLTTYLNALMKTGFEILEIIEPQPEEKLLDTIPDMKDELRRPMMLLVSAKKR